ncbi:hypothetical protein SAMN05428970_2993 [Agromyces sp. CF514]|uniref:hypothetical protein n=1 Tax=Agromyces sp. CF514 TaxID=1881031 RepID=UPI0008ECE7FA|nr:hypothetical protein [Agromyces sp. CF514]SFR84432.1 hypothetical protein SAMN05428970_2993 [Agromyces sp. CF514]
MSAPESVGDGSFAVSHVLVNELPATLGTSEEPDRYSVSAVFTRRPTPEELRLLESPAVETRLHDAGYAQAALKAVDRRLVIEHTNLAELAGGLAELVGEVLLEIGTRAGEQQRERDASSAARARDEAERAALVLDAAKRIDFRPHRSMYE